MEALLISAVDSVPPGAWAIGVSGGADSVALLTLLRSRADLSLHIVHLNHQTRGIENDHDAAFVQKLAAEYRLPCAVDQLSTMVGQFPDLPKNPSARYRRLRLALFHRVVAERQLNGVLLAHHADDQAETILHRLLRGSGPSGLAGMAASSVVGGLRCFRPLLNVHRSALRQWLDECNQPWREDPSNQSSQYLRNRLRILLAEDRPLSEELLHLGHACAALRDWVHSAAPSIVGALPVKTIGDLPHILARATARKWLIVSGVPAANIESEAIDRLLAMCLDASTPPRTQFPLGIVVARKKGAIERINAT